MYSLSTNKNGSRSKYWILDRQLVCVLILLITSSLAIADDWAYELRPSAKAIYATKYAQVSCAEVPRLLSSKAEKSVYIAVRDAALFQDKNCASTIRKHRGVLSKIPGLADVISFYEYRSGDTNGLHRLARSFDAEAKHTQDHWTVEIFGFIANWDITGRRLVRHAAYSDGAGTEVLCSALKWHRYLFGEVDFEKHWFSIGKEERVKQEILQDIFDNCRP